MGVPCGDCLLCRARRRLEWSLRLTHESQYHTSAMFVTLTIDDDHMNSDYSLRKRDYQLFLKRLRKRLDRQGKKIRYYGCGEYGDNTGRPHYHFIIFNMSALNYSDVCSVVDSWELGNVHIKVATTARMMYVAGYVTKKLAKRNKYTNEIEFDDGLLPGQETTFRTGSQGLGREWIDDGDNRVNVIENKCVTFEGYDISVPRYYKNRLVAQGYVDEEYFPAAAYSRRDEEFFRFRQARGYSGLGGMEILIIQAKRSDYLGYTSIKQVLEYEKEKYRQAKNKNIRLYTKQQLKKRGIL